MKMNICGSRLFARIKSQKLLWSGLIVAIFFAAAGSARSGQISGGSSASQLPSIEAAQQEATSYNGPVVVAVSPIFARQTQTITIFGKNFGTHSAFNGNVSFFKFTDVTQNWNAGYSGDGVTVSVTEWTDTKIVITGFTGSYGSGTWVLKAGDSIQITIWNAQLGGNGDFVTLHVTVQENVSSSIVPPRAAPLRSLYSFIKGTDGGLPEIATNLNGTLYGTTQIGGKYGDGTFFKINPNGKAPTLTLLYPFTGGPSDGGIPNALIYANGYFYGTTQVGGTHGYGTVFKISKSGRLPTPTILTNFTGGADGAYPLSGLVQGPHGNFYGTTWIGGTGGQGTVFKITPAGALKTLHSFSGNNGDGANPKDKLIRASNGNIYGAASLGGLNGNGTLFQITAADEVSNIYAFGGGNNGTGPTELVQGSDGNIYGTTSAGGSGHQGIIFKLSSAGTPAQKLEPLYNFTGGDDGSDPHSLIQGSDGNLYGVTSSGGTSGYGTVFEICETTNCEENASGVLIRVPTTVLTTMYSFDNGVVNGGVPCVLRQDSDTRFYGTTRFGGANNAGTLFALSNNAVAIPSTSEGVDYGYANKMGLIPNAEKLFADAARYRFVIRYVSSGNQKNLIAQEAQALMQAGLDIILVFEDDNPKNNYYSVLGGYANGVADAKIATNVALAAGAPQNFFCYFACDYPAPESVQPLINDYLDGVAHILGSVDRVGFYGGYGPLKRVLDAGKASKGWQTCPYDWSHGNLDWRVSLYQYAISTKSKPIIIADGEVDKDHGYEEDLGQWPVATPIFTPNGGTFVSPVPVTINCYTKDATIFYTTNGTDPTSSSTPYDSQAGINLTSSCQLKAKAFQGILTESTLPLDPSDVTNATFTIIPPLTLALTTPPIGKVGSQSSYQIKLTGGRGPYTWTCSSLTAVGLTFNHNNGEASISGTPTKTGSFNITVTATDSSPTMQTFTVPLTLVITAPSGTAPAAPSKVVATPDNAQVTVSWDPVPNTTSYNIYCASQSGVTPASYSTLPDGQRQIGVASPCTVTGLTNGKTYYFVVTAINTYGESLESRQVVATPRAVASNKIVFVSKRTGYWNIFSVNVDGSVLSNLTHDSANDQTPAVSPDHSRIAFGSDRDGNREIYVMNIDGSNPMRLTSDPADDVTPAWSPDGQKIAFVSARVGNQQIYTVNADGTGLTRVTNDSGNDTQPSWSPDGRKIVYVSDRDGNKEIYSINVNGSNPVNLSQNSANDNSPFFSPDGSSIAFISDRDADFELWLMSANGANPRKVTTLGSNQVGWFAWSPDGSRIAFDSQADGHYHIYVVRADGGGYKQLTQGSFDDRFSSWTWDGRWITFVSNRDGNSEIYLIDPDGNHPLDLSNDPSDDELPSPSPVYNSGGGCFIATAAFGSYLDPHVIVLRHFRDQRLLTNHLGRRAVAFYYQFSPPIANYIAKHDHLRTVVRWLLTPIIYSVEYPRFAVAIFSVLAILAISRRWKRFCKVLRVSSLTMLR